PRVGLDPVRHQHRWCLQPRRRVRTDGDAECELDVRAQRLDQPRQGRFAQRRGGRGLRRGVRRAPVRAGGQRLDDGELQLRLDPRLGRQRLAGGGARGQLPRFVPERARPARRGPPDLRRHRLLHHRQRLAGGRLRALHRRPVRGEPVRRPLDQLRAPGSLPRRPLWRRTASHRRRARRLSLLMAGVPATVALPGARVARPGARAWIVLAILCFVYVLNFLDRQLLSILAKPIQDELGVSDGQLGLIGGLYFAMFYCILAIPVGWLADRTNRVRVLAIACGLWSAATAACGMASSYPQLALARMPVGVGEAGGVPPWYAISSDYLPPGTRGTALGLFNLGPPIGAALGVAFGASVAAAYSWRMAFISVGVVGMVTAVGVWLLVREPRKGGLDAAPSPQAGATSAVAPSGF